VKHLTLFITLVILWLLLTWSLAVEQIVVGVVCAFLLTLFLARLYRESSTKVFNPLRWWWFLVYVVNFIYYCVKANFDVAYRVLHPDLPIRPAIIKVHTNLKTDMARTFLANSITLTPGTLTVDILQDGDLFIHWINVTTSDPQQQNEIIVKRFETILRRVFE